MEQKSEFEREQGFASGEALAGGEFSPSIMPPGRLRPDLQERRDTPRRSDL